MRTAKILCVLLAAALIGCANESGALPGHIPSTAGNRSRSSESIVRRQSADGISHWEVSYALTSPQRVDVRIDCYPRTRMAREAFKKIYEADKGLTEAGFANADEARARALGPGSAQYGRAVVRNGEVIFDFLPASGRLSKGFVEEFLAKFFNRF
jgi:hypothetical protein